MTPSGEREMCMQRLHKRTWSTVVLIFLLVSFWFGNNHLTAKAATAIPAENNGQATTPFMGWSTWNYIGSNPNATNVYAQAQVVASKLKGSGYNYVLLDDFYYLNPSTTVDANGYWVTDTNKFPGGLAALATKVHALGLKFGAYLTPGVPVAAVQNKSKIIGTNYTADQIADTSKFEINYNYGNKIMYYIDYSKPGAQAYINGWAKQLASWGVDFLKIDGVGSFDIPDVLAWDTALQQSGRPILFDLSNSLSINDISTWRVHANAWRISGDVQCYCSSGLVTW